LQRAVSALPSTGGEIFVKAGVYSITSTIQIAASDVHIQGEGMGTTVFAGNSTMTGNTPALDIHNSMVDTALGDITLKISRADAASFSAGDYILLYSNKGRHGIGLLPQDRKEQGFVQRLSVTQNITLASLPAFSRYTIPQTVQKS
jgi:hypothetical protein